MRDCRTHGVLKDLLTILKGQFPFSLFMIILIPSKWVFFSNQPVLHLSGYQLGVLQFSSILTVVQSLSCVRLFETPETATHQASLSFTISRSVLKLVSIEW